MTIARIVSTLIETAGVLDQLEKQFATKLPERIKKDRNLRHTGLNTKSTSRQILEYISKFDPTKTKYLAWITKTWVQGGINYLEDLPRVKEALTIFDKYKVKLEKKDIGQYKTLADLEEAVEPFTIKKGNEANLSKKDLEKNFYETKQAKLILDTPRFKIVEPLTKKASQFFGVNTKWCTSAKTNNMFSAYKPHVRLFYVLNKDNTRFAVVIPKKSEEEQEDSNSRYDDIYTVEVFDEKDKNVDPIAYLNNNPEIKKALITPLKKYNDELLLHRIGIKISADVNKQRNDFIDSLSAAAKRGNSTQFVQILAIEMNKEGTKLFADEEIVDLLISLHKKYPKLSVHIRISDKLRDMLIEKTKEPVLFNDTVLVKYTNIESVFEKHPEVIKKLIDNYPPEHHLVFLSHFKLGAKIIDSLPASQKIYEAFPVQAFLMSKKKLPDNMLIKKLREKGEVGSKWGMLYVLSQYDLNILFSKYSDKTLSEALKYVTISMGDDYSEIVKEGLARNIITTQFADELLIRKGVGRLDKENLAKLTKLAKQTPR